MHTPCVELTVSAVRQISLSGSSVLIFVTSISLATTCSPLSSVVSSEEGVMSTGSFSLFLFWIRFFFVSRDKHCYSDFIHHTTDTWTITVISYLLVHICVAAPPLEAAVWSCHSESVAENRNITNYSSGIKYGCVLLLETFFSCCVLDQCVCRL